MFSQNSDSMKMEKKKAIYQKKDHHQDYFDDDQDCVPRKIYEDFECRNSNCRFQHKKPISIHGNHYGPEFTLHPPNPRSFSPPYPHRLPPPPFPPPYPHRLHPPPPNLHHPRYCSGPIVPQYNQPNLYHPCYHGGPIAPRYHQPNLHYQQCNGGPQYDCRGGCLDTTNHRAGRNWPLSPVQLSPYDYRGARHVPAEIYDSTHFFSDENAVGCTVM